MLLFLYIIFIEALTRDVVQSECIPAKSPRVIDANVNLNGSYYVNCYIDEVCQNSQYFIFYHCDINGKKCEQMFVYFLTNDSISFYQSIKRSLYPYFRQDYIFRMHLNSVRAADDGIWKVYIRSTTTSYECVNINITTYVRPKEEIRVISFKAPTYTKFNMTCLVNEIRPVYRLYLEINDFEFRNGIQIDTQNGDTWNISYSVELVLSPNYQLKTRCFIAYRSYFNKNDLWAYSYNFVFNPFEDNPLTFHPFEEAVITCVIPVNSSLIGWTKNNLSVLVSNIFTVTPISVVSGFFDFPDPDVTTAQYSELRFVLPRLDQGCDAINEYSGDYACEAVNTDFGNSFTSAARHVLVEYAPTIESKIEGKYDVSTRPAATVMIVCPICSYPPVEEYKWLKGNIQQGNERTFVISYVTESGFGKYTCIATNTMGSTNVTVNVIKMVDRKSKLYQGYINEKINMECPLCDDTEKECSWQINDKQIHTGRFYPLESLTEEDYGEYVCTAVFANGRTWMHIGLTKPQANNVGGTESYINASEMQRDPRLTTDVIAGFAVLGIVVVGMIVAITVLSFILIRKQRSRDDATGELSTNATTSEETPHIYEKINVSFGNNPVYENTQP